MTTSLLIYFSFRFSYKQSKLAPSEVLDDITVLDASNIGNVMTMWVH